MDCANFRCSEATHQLVFGNRGCTYQTTQILYNFNERNLAKPCLKQQAKSNDLICFVDFIFNYINVFI